MNMQMFIEQVESPSVPSSERDFEIYVEIKKVQAAQEQAEQIKAMAEAVNNLALSMRIK